MADKEKGKSDEYSFVVKVKIILEKKVLILSTSMNSYLLPKLEGKKKNTLV